jgi:hypothetical protein
MMRGMHRYPFHQLDDEPLQAGDVVVYLSSTPARERAEARAAARESHRA